MESTMRRVITDILIIVFTCIMMQCVEFEEEIYPDNAQIVLVNKTGENIYPFMNWFNINRQEKEDHFPQIWYDVIVVKPNDSVSLDPVLRLLKYNSCKLYILGQTTFDKYSQKEIIENCVYDKVYTFVYEDLEKNDFTTIIDYTGGNDQ